MRAIPAMTAAVVGALAVTVPAVASAEEVPAAPAVAVDDPQVPPVAPAPSASPLASTAPEVPPPVPADSGTGRRVVYDMGQMRVWLIEANGTVFNSHLVSGHKR